MRERTRTPENAYQLRRTTAIVADRNDIPQGAVSLRDDSIEYIHQEVGSSAARKHAHSDALLLPLVQLLMLMANAMLLQRAVSHLPGLGRSPKSVR